MNKRGWTRILEATVAVMMIAGAMMAVYSEQPSRVTTIEEYSYSIQQEILDDVASNSSLRMAVLRVEDDVPGDENYDLVNAFVGEGIPVSFGYLLRICDLGDDFDFCKMAVGEYAVTMGYDIFVEDAVVSAELGDGSDAVNSPKKVRLFFWEGGFPPGYCRDECPSEGDFFMCSDGDVARRACGYFMAADPEPEDCLVWVGTGTVVESCADGCFYGACSGFYELVCEDRSEEIVAENTLQCGTSSPYDRCVNDGGYDGVILNLRPIIIMGMSL